MGTSSIGAGKTGVEVRKIISIALFGDPERKGTAGMRYHPFLAPYLLSHLNLFPAAEGWELHVHVDDITLNSSYGQMLTRVSSRVEAVKTIMMGSALLTRSMLWRLRPAFSSTIDYTFCRDIDCISLPRDRAICDTFIASNCAIHAPADSQSHAGLMGGMIGLKNSAFRIITGIESLDQLYDFAKKSEAEWATHGTDQLVLNRLIDRADGPTLLEHRYNGWHAGPGKYPARKAGEYRCKSWSTPVPDVGKSKLSPELQAQADLLANHLGAAGYPIDAARAFWEEHGDRAITKLVKECEA